MTQVYLLSFPIEQTHLFLAHASVGFLEDIVAELTTSAESLSSGFDLDLPHVWLILGGPARYPRRVLLLVKGGSLGD